MSAFGPFGKPEIAPEEQFGSELQAGSFREEAEPPPGDAPWQRRIFQQQIEVAETVSPGDLLSPDADGKGVVSSTAGAPIGARALEPATAAGQKIRVAVEFQRVVPQS